MSFRPTTAAIGPTDPTRKDQGEPSTTTSSGPSSTTPNAPELGATTAVPLSVLEGENSAPFSVARTLNVPAGWKAEVWARVPDARMEARSPEGDLLVSEPDEGKVVELVPGVNAETGPTERIILSGLTQPQGLAFARLDSSEVLYVGESNQIDRYEWKATAVTGEHTVIAGDLPDLDPTGDDVHRQKDVVVAPNGTIYFNVSSSSNADPDDRTMTPPRAVIMAVKPNGSGLHVVETGVRNGEGLAVAPDGTVWTGRQ